MKICKEPGCPNPASVRGWPYDATRCEYCAGQSDCDRVRCQNKAQRSTLCRPCAELLHPGVVFYLGRWRSRAEVYERISGDRAMRGVMWTLEPGAYVGVKGSFRIVLIRDTEIATNRVEMSQISEPQNRKSA